MQSGYLIVDKRILPGYYEKVLQAREMLREGKVKEVSEAARLVGISRSTYYKYKDYIFSPGESAECSKAVFSLLLRHEPGILNALITALSELGANILTITQSLPIGGNASVLLSLDTSAMQLPAQEVLTRLSALRGASSVKLVAIE
ncbi:MAG: ACT domain-containing protein [Christensenellaceae bacterium]|jgi:chorismate mutase|nr:ACT domain-containing protein [Christensenellaceae bacterium]